MKGATTGFCDCRLPAHTIPSHTFHMFSATFLNDRRFFQTPFEHLSQGPALLDLCFLLVGGILLLEYAANLFSTCLSTISNFEDLHSSQQPSVRYSRSSSNKALPSLLTLVKLLCVFSSITSFSC